MDASTGSGGAPGSGIAEPDGSPTGAPGLGGATNSLDTGSPQDRVDGDAASGTTDNDAGCEGPQCSSTCGADQHRCGARCVAADDFTACGSSCAPCVAAPNQHAACVAGACQSECSIVCSESPSACPRANWDFESGSNGLEVEVGGLSDARAHTGRYSAASRKWVKSPAIEGGWIKIQINVCTGTADLLGRALSAWVYLEGSEFVVGRETSCHFGFDVENGFNSVGSTAVPGPNRWFQVTAKPFLSTKTSYLAVICWIKPVVGETWPGTVYFDDVGIQ
jgi:hypothetical protein